MQRPAPGRHVRVATTGEPFDAFVPAPLPPAPPLVWSPALRRRFDDALLALGRLDAITAHLPNASLLLYGFVRKEAVLSSQIEGTQSSLAHLESLAVVGELTNRQRGRVFSYTAYVQELARELEPGQ